MFNSITVIEILASRLYVYSRVCTRAVAACTAGCRLYCILGSEEVAAKHAHGAVARVSVNFRNCFPCIARAACARGFDSLPSLSDVQSFSFRWIIHFWYFCLQKLYKASLALCRFFMQKYQKGFIHRKLRLRTSVIVLYPKIQYSSTRFPNLE
jgi:hypothetical protein